MTRSYFWHDPILHVVLLIHECGMTRSYVRSYVWRDSFLSVTWLFRMRDMTFSYSRHDSSMSVVWLVHMCDITRSYVRHCSFFSVTWLVRMSDMTRSNRRHDSFMSVTAQRGFMTFYVYHSKTMYTLRRVWNEIVLHVTCRTERRTEKARKRFGGWERVRGWLVRVKACVSFCVCVGVREKARYRETERLGKKRPIRECDNSTVSWQKKHMLHSFKCI